MITVGIPGLVLWCSLVFGGMVSCVRLRRRLPRAWLKGDAEERFLYQATLYLQLAFIGFAVCALLLLVPVGPSDATSKAWGFRFAVPAA